jgi:putative glycosyl hydrolase
MFSSEPLTIAVGAPPPAISSDFFGMTINGFSEPALVWPAWSPTTFRVIDQFSTANPMLFVPDWKSTEPSNGSFTWTQWDAVWAKYISEGVTSFLVAFQGIPSWAEPGAVFNIPAVTAFVTAYLTRATLDGLPVKYVEGVNEPNDGGSFFNGTITDLVNIQQAIYNAAKAFDSTITVLAPPINSAGSIAYLQSFLAAGGGAYFDVLAYHAYPSGSIVSGVGTSPERIVGDVAALKSAMSAVGISKPIWITEYSANGGSTPTPAQNATFAAITCLLACSLGLVRQYWYSYDNAGGFGLLWTSGGGLNAAGVAWQQMTKWMIGAFVTQTAQLTGVVYTMSFSRPGGYQAQAVWTTDGSTPTFPTPAWATQYHDTAGGKTTGLGATVTLGRNPILLESGNVF